MILPEDNEGEFVLWLITGTRCFRLLEGSVLDQGQVNVGPDQGFEACPEGDLRTKGSHEPGKLKVGHVTLRGPARPFRCHALQNPIAYETGTLRCLKRDMGISFGTFHAGYYIG